MPTCMLILTMPMSCVLTRYFKYFWSWPGRCCHSRNWGCCQSQRWCSTKLESCWCLVFWPNYNSIANPETLKELPIPTWLIPTWIMPMSLFWHNYKSITDPKTLKGLPILTLLSIPTWVMLMAWRDSSQDKHQCWEQQCWEWQHNVGISNPCIIGSEQKTSALIKSESTFKLGLATPSISCSAIPTISD